MFGITQVYPGNSSTFKTIFFLSVVMVVWCFLSLLYTQPSVFKDLKFISDTRENQQQAHSSQGQRRVKTTRYINVTEMQEIDKLEIIATILTKNLTQIQRNAECKVTLSCGHSDRCGLGCQLHHRSLCLFMSYTFGIPLIHDASGYWPYTNPWQTVFRPLGSECVPGNETIYVTWRVGGCPLMSYKELSSNMRPQHSVPSYPLKNGLPMDISVKSMLNDSHPQPFMWLVGFFLNYTMKLQPDFNHEYEIWRSQLIANVSRPIVGVHVRRTDKISEAKDSYHTIHEYIKKVEIFFQNSSELPRTLYIASDDASVLKSFQQNYTLPRWNIIGQRYVKGRIDGLDEIVKDVLFLTEADYLVCGLSSNVCRLVHELRSYRDRNASNKLISMDHPYDYAVLGCGLPSKIRWYQRVFAPN